MIFFFSALPILAGRGPFAAWTWFFSFGSFRGSCFLMGRGDSYGWFDTGSWIVSCRWSFLPPALPHLLFRTFPMSFFFFFPRVTQGASSLRSHCFPVFFFFWCLSPRLRLSPLCNVISLVAPDLVWRASFSNSSLLLSVFRSSGRTSTTRSSIPQKPCPL